MLKSEKYKWDEYGFSYLWLSYWVKIKSDAILSIIGSNIIMVTVIQSFLLHII